MSVEITADTGADSYDTKRESLQNNYRTAVLRARYSNIYRCLSMSVDSIVNSALCLQETGE